MVVPDLCKICAKDASRCRCREEIQKLIAAADKKTKAGELCAMCGQHKPVGRAPKNARHMVPFHDETAEWCLACHQGWSWNRGYEAGRRHD